MKILSITRNRARRWFALHHILALSFSSSHPTKPNQRSTTNATSALECPSTNSGPLLLLLLLLQRDSSQPSPNSCGAHRFRLDSLSPLSVHHGTPRGNSWCRNSPPPILQAAIPDPLPNSSSETTRHPQPTFTSTWDSPVRGPTGHW